MRMHAYCLHPFFLLMVMRKLQVLKNQFGQNLVLFQKMSDDVIAELAHAFGDNIDTISHEKLLVLAACVSDGYVSNYRLQFVLDRHPVEITQLLKELCEDGLLKASGIGKGRKYKLNVASKVSGNVASKVSPKRNVSNRTPRLYEGIQDLQHRVFARSV